MTPSLPDPQQCVAKAIAQLKDTFPCLRDDAFAIAVGRLFSFGNMTPADDDMGTTWAVNSLSLDIPQYYWGRNGLDNHGKPRLAYIQRIAAMDDDKLGEETKGVIGRSALASNNNQSDYHWQSHVCWCEWVARGKPDGYQKAYEGAWR